MVPVKNIYMTLSVVMRRNTEEQLHHIAEWQAALGAISYSMLIYWLGRW